MELRQLEAFVSISATRNFRASANRLNLSQPAISFRVKGLEERLGVKLFDRVGKSVKLTGAGLKLLPIAEKILDGARDMEAAAAGRIDLTERIRLGVTSTIANAWLPDLIGEALKAHSHLVFDVVVDTTPHLRKSLIEGRSDVALLMGAVHEPGIRSIPLGSYRSAWVAGETMALPDRKVSLQELAAIPILTYAKDSATYTNLEEVLRETGCWPAKVNTCASVGTMLRILSRGNHVGVLCSACLPYEGVKRFECDLDFPAYEFYIAYHLNSIGTTGLAIADVARSVFANK